MQSIRKFCHSLFRPGHHYLTTALLFLPRSLSSILNTTHRGILPKYKLNHVTVLLRALECSPLPHPHSDPSMRVCPGPPHLLHLPLFTPHPKYQISHHHRPWHWLFPLLDAPPRQLFRYLLTHSPCIFGEELLPWSPCLKCPVPSIVFYYLLYPCLKCLVPSILFYYQYTRLCNCLVYCLPSFTRK